MIIGTEQGTTFPTRIGNSICNALIDTGATKNCISERYYQQLPAMQMHTLNHISVKSATGSNLTPLGVIYCSFELGKVTFDNSLIVCRNEINSSGELILLGDFNITVNKPSEAVPSIFLDMLNSFNLINRVVCRNLTRPLILGRDFLLQHNITVRYTANGRCVLDYQQQELISSIDTENKPQLYMTHTVDIPGRTLAIIAIHNDLDPRQSGSLYEIRPNDTLVERYPNLCIIPMIHNVDVYRNEYLPLVFINFAIKYVYLSKGESMGYMSILSLEISEILTETSTESSSLMCEDDEMKVFIKQEKLIKRRK